MITEKDVGTFWLHDDGTVWQLVSYTPHPTVKWARVDDPATRCGGVVGSLITRPFRRLVPEGERSQ